MDFAPSLRRSVAPGVNEVGITKGGERRGRGGGGAAELGEVRISHVRLRLRQLFRPFERPKEYISSYPFPLMFYGSHISTGSTQRQKKVKKRAKKEQ